jgi:hypothetical protein
VLYGLPTHEGFEAEERGEVHLGGCEVTPYGWWCEACEGYVEPRPDPWHVPPVSVEEFQLCLVWEMRRIGLGRPVGVTLSGRYADARTRSTARQKVRETLLSARPAFEAMTAVLGEPVHRGTREVDGRRARVHAFTVPLWPDFLYEVTGDDRGFVVGERFVRVPGAPVPSLDDVADLRPWKVLRPELEKAFEPVVRCWRKGSSYDGYSFRHLSNDGVLDVVEAYVFQDLLEWVNVPNWGSPAPGAG